MANLKSSKKDVRRTAKRTIRNREAKSELKTLAKRVTQLGQGAEAREAAIAYVSALDKAAKRGIIHVNRARRGKRARSSLIFASAA
jgi:small subunit ribosomal protein S20